MKKEKKRKSSEAKIDGTFGGTTDFNGITEEGTSINVKSDLADNGGNEESDFEDDEFRKKIGKNKKSYRKIKTEIKYGEDMGENATFENFNFDERLLKAVGEIGWEKPTQIQQNLIPLILEGKNVTARGRTGSGKTGAFVLPIIQKIVQLTSATDKDVCGPFALFITPSKELASQVFKLLQQLTSTFPFLLSMNYASIDFSDEKTWPKESPDLLVTTPSRLLSVLRKNGDFCAEIRFVVLDEADLLLSYGYEDEMREIKSYLPSCYQSVFTSATLTEEIGPLKNLINGPIVTLRLKEGQLPDTGQLLQYHVNCRNDEERFAILLALVKLKLLVGKTIIFVQDTNRCYKLGLFLHGFKIFSCILNSNMPVNSRCHIVREFNEGRYNYVIASDINDVFLGDPKAGSLTKKARQKMDKESGVSRGIDFHHVSNVINFDFPRTTELYIHRVGRTARGWNKGTALSFTSHSERKYFEKVRSDLKKQMGHEVIIPYDVRMNELDAFLLRARDGLAACTKTAIREARLAEIRGELLRSKKLEGYFAKNPREKASLEHDKKLFTISLNNPAIGDVPDYIVPQSLRGGDYHETNIKPIKKKPRKRKWFDRAGSGTRNYMRKMKDPLQSFSL